jgi:hypothetical protein
MHLFLRIFCRIKKVNHHRIKVMLRRQMRWAGQVSCVAEMRNVRKILVGKPEGKRLLARTRHMWKDNIKIHLEEIQCRNV